MTHKYLIIKYYFLTHRVPHNKILSFWHIEYFIIKYYIFDTKVSNECIDKKECQNIITLVIALNHCYFFLF